jgi:hypothetical protein
MVAFKPSTLQRFFEQILTTYIIYFEAFNDPGFTSFCHCSVFRSGPNSMYGTRAIVA